MALRRPPRLSGSHRPTSPSSFLLLPSLFSSLRFSLSLVLSAVSSSAWNGMGVYQTVSPANRFRLRYRYSGPTVHFVDEHYDTGRILAQRVVPVLANDTAEQLAGRVLQQEHQIYVEVVSALCEERIIWREDGVPLIRSKENPNGYY